MSDRERCKDCKYVHYFSEESELASCNYPVPYWALPSSCVYPEEYITCPTYEEKPNESL